MAVAPVPKRVERRRRILDAVRDAIVREGIDQVRIRALAEQCGVAVATLYNQFGSRDGLIAAALEQDFRGRYEPLSFRTKTMTAGEKFRQRMVASARSIGSLKAYTQAVLGFYFQPNIDPKLRAVLHDFVTSDFRSIVADIASAGDLHPWVDDERFASDVVTQLYSITVTWLQGYRGGATLRDRLLYAGAIAFAGISTGTSRDDFLTIARNAAK